MAKGGSFEREIARDLSLWWSFGKRDDIFYRSHASGARFTQRKKAGKDTAYQSGDITCSDPDGKDFIDRFSVECKTGYGSKSKKGVVRWDILDLIDSKQKETVFNKMWKQCINDAISCGKTPILIFRRNQRSPCIVFKNALFNKIVDFFNAPTTSFIRADGLIIMNLKDFFEWCPDIRVIV